MTDDVRTLLWEWRGELEDPDAEQRVWKEEYFEGMLRAVERLGLAHRSELLDAPAAPRGDPTAAEAHLERLLAEIRPLTRAEDPEQVRAGRRFMGALQALAEAGLVDRRQWHARELEASAPWLERGEVEELASGEGFYAIHVPATTPEEEAEDEAWERLGRAMRRRGPLLRVATCRTPPRAEGLAVTAALVRGECVDLHFHFVGPPLDPGTRGFAFMEETEAMVAALPVPRLTDDAGTVYESVVDRPLHSSGPGGQPDQERPSVITGTWRYLPAPPADARRFTAAVAETRWALE